MNATDLTRRPALWGSQGWLGLLLLAVCWPLNWTLPGNRTAYLFFPLWLGYILVVDALVLSRTGTSLWTRSRREFMLLFVASVPAWWIFEAINRRTGNWEYLGGSAFTDLEYYLLCTISFSTVMPAVFETADWGRVTPAGWACVTYVATIPMTVAYLAWFRALRLVPASMAATTVLVSPMVGVMGSTLVLGETLGPRQVVALGVTLAGVALAARG